MTYNEQYLDESIRHQIDILRFGSGVARKVNALLDATTADMKRQVERRLGKTTGVTGASLRRLQELERAIYQVRSPAWNDVTETWERSAIDVALEEPIFLHGTLTSILPVELDLVAPSDAALEAMVTHRPFNGRTLKEWADSARRADLNRIQQQIRIGMVQGESAQRIANRVFGERGAMQITRNQAEAVTRTVINGTSNAAQQLFLQENSDLFDIEQLVATLDARTTPVCRAEDGKQYPFGKGPMPPLHVACRSIRVAVIDGEVVGERPFKAGTEQQMLREYAAARGLERVPKSRDDLPRGSKRDFDAFSRRRMKELTGQVPARTTYQEWLSRQPSEIQDDILGPTRGALFREGGLTLDKFVNRNGDELTIEELRERNRDAFKKAGLLPADQKSTAPPPPPAPANDTVPPAPAPKKRSLVEAMRQSGTAVWLRGAPSPEQQEAVLRGLDKAALPNTSPLHRLVLTDQIGSTDEASLPERVGGDYHPLRQILRVSSSKQTNERSFLRKRRLQPFNTLLPDNTQNIAQSLDEVIEMTTVHEYAHHAHLSRQHGKVDAEIRKEFLDPKRQDVSRYGTENHQEFWAEAFTAYHYYPRVWMQHRAPRTLAFVERIIKMVEENQ